MSKDKGKSTTTTSLPAFVQQPASELIPGLVGASGQFSLSPEAETLLSGILGGSFLGQGEDFQQQLQAAENQIIPQVASIFQGAGRGTGGLATQAASEGIGNAFAGLLNQERTRQVAALPFAFQQAGMPFNQQLSLLQALLGGPRDSTTTTKSSPGLLSTLGTIAGIGGAFGGFPGAPQLFGEAATFGSVP